MGNLPLVNEYAWTADDYKVAQQMKAYFANFIKTGNPNGDGLVAWPAVSATDPAPAVLVIDVASKAVPAKNEARYRLLDELYRKR